MDTQTLVAAQGLARTFGGNRAVDDVSLALHKGEVLGLLGPNGAGKTTTLRMLAGCLAPTRGRVEINGVDMARAPTRAKRGLGYLPERPPLYPELTVDEYLRCCARLHRIPRRQRRDAVASAKRDCGLSQVGQRVIGHLSKGFQQRVGIAQAIVHRPDVVILDEPTVGLDPNQIREIRSLITRLGTQHSVLLSSHILPEIQATCSRVVIIHRGRVVFDRAMDAIGGDDEALTLRLGLTRAPGAGELGRIEGVTRVQQRQDGLWQLDCAAQADPRAAIAARAADAGWGLYELHAQRRTLEEIFADLTSRDAAREAA